MFSNIAEEEGLLTRNMSHDADFDTEVKDTFGKYGLDGIWERIDSWKGQPVNIAVSLYHSPKSACFFVLKSQPQSVMKVLCSDSIGRKKALKGSNFLTLVAIVGMNFYHPIVIQISPFCLVALNNVL